VCFTLTALGKTRGSSVLSPVLHQVEGNEDGFFLRVARGSKDYALRTLDLAEFLEFAENFLAQEVDFIHLHFRSASAGAISEENVHGWQFEQEGLVYTFTHFGSGAYSTLDVSDSRFLFKMLKGKERLDLSTFKTAVEAGGRTGIYILASPKRVFVAADSSWGTLHVYWPKQTSVLILSSHEVDFFDSPPLLVPERTYRKFGFSFASFVERSFPLEPFPDEVLETTLSSKVIELRKYRRGWQKVGEDFLFRTSSVLYGTTYNWNWDDWKDS